MAVVTVVPVLLVGVWEQEGKRNNPGGMNMGMVRKAGLLAATYNPDVDWRTRDRGIADGFAPVVSESDWTTILECHHDVDPVPCRCLRLDPLPFHFDDVWRRSCEPLVAAQ